ncbi:MAG: hypothetical protein DRO11_05265 [Methanobacteriota archaeon]|nr:MAG: hypothetical protein DRO11_05265 [Euryarchaeota archaeon]
MDNRVKDANMPEVRITWWSHTESLVNLLSTPLPGFPTKNLLKIKIMGSSQLWHSRFCVVIFCVSNKN